MNTTKAEAIKATNILYMNYVIGLYLIKILGVTVTSCFPYNELENLIEKLPEEQCRPLRLPVLSKDHAMF